MEELQQQVTTLKVKEATLTKNNAEATQRCQELNTHLTDVETEERKTKEEVRGSNPSHFEGLWRTILIPSCLQSYLVPKYTNVICVWDFDVLLVSVKNLCYPCR